MHRTHAVALLLALATVFVTTIASADPPTRDEIQAPRGEQVETP